MDNYLSSQVGNFREKGLFQKALFLQTQRKFKEAIYCYQHILKFHHDWPEVYYNLGFLWEKENNFLEAVHCYQQAIIYNPSFSEAYYNLAVLYQQEGLIENAIETYEKAIFITPQLIDAYINLGCLLIKLENYLPGIEILKKANSLLPKNPIIYNNLGKSFFYIGKLDQAIAYYLKAINLQHNLLEGYENLGQAFYFQNLFDSAYKFWQQALEIQPNSISLHSQCISALMGQNKYSEVSSHLQRVVKLEQSFVIAYSQWAEQVNTEDILDQATTACGKLLKILQQENFQSIEIQQYLSFIYLHLGKVLAIYRNYPMAELYYQKAITIQPEYSEAYLAWGDCLAKQWKFNAAALQYHHALGLQPNNLHLYQKIGEVLEKQQQAEEGAIKFSFAKERELLKPPPQNSSQNHNTKCLGLDCQPCLKNLRQHFKPQVLGAGIEQYFPPNSLPFQFQPTTVAILPQGRAWIAPKMSWWNVCNAIAIFNQQKELIPELSRFYPTPLPGCQNYDWSQHQIFSLEELPPLKIIEGQVAVLSGLSGNVYFHWMVDILPRFDILQQKQIDFNSIDFFLINSQQQPFQKETLEKLGIPSNKILESDQVPYLEASSLIVPSFPSPVGWTVSRTIQFLRNLFSQTTPPKNIYPKRIYISRNKARYRRVLNETELINYLSKFGFILVELENLSVQEQADLFAQAEIIIVAHGAGLTNLIFCKPQTTIVELFSPNYVRHYYWIISQQLGLKHYSLKGETLKCSFLRSLMYSNPLFEDLWISLRSIKRLMEILQLDNQQYQNRNFSNNSLMNVNLDYSLKTGSLSNYAEPLGLNYYHKVQKLLDQQQYQDCIYECEKIVKAQFQPKAMLYWLWGKALRALSQEEEAKQRYEQAINLEPEQINFYFDLGELYIQQQNWQKAIDCYQKMILIQPSVLGYQGLVRAWQALGESKNADDCLYEALCLEPEQFTIEESLQLAERLWQTGQKTQATICYHQLCKIQTKEGFIPDG
jgi:tetratricopeptide (TPR) repeat protein